MLKIKPFDNEKLQTLSYNEGMSVNEFIKRRNSLIDQMDLYRPDFRKSQDAKRNWRLNRREFTKAIKKWHKSTDGKLFHRQLNRFNALREEYESKLDPKFLEYICGLTNVISEINSERQYMVPDMDFHLNYLEFLDMLESIIEKIKEKLKAGMKFKELITDEDWQDLDYIEHQYALIKPNIDGIKL